MLHSWIKRALQAILIVLLGTLLLLGALEVVCRFVGLPAASKFTATILEENGIFRPKKATGSRIFLLGDSTMHGWQYAPQSTIGTWLDQYLNSFIQDKEVQIINFGRLGEGSAFCLDTLKELLPYHPDLVVVYVGHNEFYPTNRRVQVEEEADSSKSQLRKVLRKSYLVTTIERLVNHVKRAAKEKIIREDPIEITPRGFAHDETSSVGSLEYEDCLLYFRENIEAIIKLAKEKDIPLVFFKVVSNTSDFSPNHSVFSRDHADNVKKLYLARLEEATELLDGGNPAKADKILDDLLRVDSLYAETLYEKARALKALGQFKEANLFYLEAVDYDAVHDRAPRAINRILEELCTKYNVLLIDSCRLLKERSPNSIIGYEMIDDDRHPTVIAQSLMARELARTIWKNGWIAPSSEWRWGNEESYETYIKRLGIDCETYYEAYLRLALYLGSRHEEAMKWIRRALVIHPESFQARRHLAWRYWIMDRKSEALAIYRKLLLDYPDKTRPILKRHSEVREAFEAKYPQMRYTD